MNKSSITCGWCIESEHKAGDGLFRMWTFTFAEVLPVKVASARWHLLSKALVRKLGFRGVRVYELHPGGHGLHVHCVTGRYYHCETVLGLARKYGFGRIDVQLLTRNRKYVTKYLGKSRALGLKGMRVWQRVGWGADEEESAPRVRDCVVDSPITRIGRTLTVLDMLDFYGESCRTWSRRVYTWYKYRLASRMWAQPGEWVGSRWVGVLTRHFNSLEEAIVGRTYARGGRLAAMAG